MSVLSRLFGKKTPPKTRTSKTVSLDGMSPEALVNIVLGSAKAAGDEQLRIRALQKLNDEKSLSEIAFGESSATYQRMAKQRLADLIDVGQIDLDRLRKQVNDPLKVFGILSFSEKTELLEQLLDSITDTAVLAKVVREGSTVKLRQSAAEKIVDRVVLLELLKETKGKDKTVYKIIKDKCDLFKEEEKSKAATEAATEAVARALQQHSNRVFDPQYTAKFHLLEQQWQALVAQADPQLQSEVQAAVEKCQALIDSVESAQVQEEVKAIELAATDNSRREIIARLRELVKVAALDQIVPEQYVSINEEWQKNIEHKVADKKEQQIVEQLFVTLEELSALTKQYGSLTAHVAAAGDIDEVNLQEQKMPIILSDLKSRLRAQEHFSDSEIPPVFVDAQAAIDRWSKVRADKKAEQQNIQRQIGGLIRKSNESASHGKLKQAVGLRRAIDEKIPLLANLPAHLQSQLQQLDETLVKLQDWKDYAVLPKKHELIAQMKGLLDSKDHPDALATKIKHLQDEWKSLSKGGSLLNEEQDQELWDEFHRIAQEAYQPCRDYFAEQAAIRQKNLESCQTLVKQLQDYYAQYDWDSPQWKDVEKVMHVARQEWRSYTPTERAATQPVKAEFDAVLESIAEKLHEEQRKNAAAKEVLVGQAKQLVELSDMRKGADEVKRLQAQWQQIGVTARSTDQKLWREFRAACDAVFARKQEDAEKFKQELNENLERAQALLVEISALQKQSGQALLDARKQVDELQSAFNSLGALPKNNAGDIKAAFAKAIEAFEQKIKHERNAAKQQVWLNLFDANNKLRELQLAVVSAKTAEQGAALIADGQAIIASFDQLPGGGAKALESKLAFSPETVDVPENQKALRLLCIRAEVLTGQETPVGDQPLRMEHQVKMLEQNFGQKVQDTRAEFDSLIFEWLAVGPLPATQYDPLFERFYASWLKVFK